MRSDHNLIQAHLDIEDTFQCLRDGLFITAVDGEKNRQIGRYCGTQGPNQEIINTDSNDLIIVFNSDLAGSLTGFKLQFSTETEGSVCPNTIQLSAPSGQIASKIVDTNYNRMLSCSWLIKAAENQVVEVGIDAMNSDSDCLQDHLSLYNGPTQADREIAKICGRAIRKKFSSTGPEMYIVWHNDNPSSEKQVVFSYRVKDRKYDLVKPDEIIFTYSISLPQKFEFFLEMRIDIENTFQPPN